MDDSHPDRMATPKRRGPQPGPINTPPPMPAERVDVTVTLPGVRCPGCGRGMVPRRAGSSGGKHYAWCVLCAARIALTFDEAGQIATVRLVRNGEGAS